MREIKNTAHFLFTFTILLLILSTTAEPATEWARKKIDTFRGTLKIWHVYTRSCIESHMHQFQCHSPRKFQLQSYLSDLLKFVSHHKSHNSSDTLFNGLSAAQDRYFDFLHKKGQLSPATKPLQLTITLKNVTGGIILSSALQAAAHPLFQSYCREGFIIKDDCHTPHGYPYFSALRLLWTLSTHLALNITFHGIHFTSGSANFVKSFVFCDFGRLEVYSVLGNLKDSNAFCGHFPVMSVLLRFPMNCIELIVYPSTAYLISGQFSVVDAKLQIRSLRVKHRFLSGLPLLLLEIWTLLTFTIEVFKTSQISLYSQENMKSILVLDGPGFSAPEIRPIQGVYHPTSFKCFVVSVQAFCIHNCSLPYSTSGAAITEWKKQGNTSFSLPAAGFCSEFLCLISFQFDSKSQVNLTVSDMSYVGEQSAVCEYGGFVALNRVEGKFKENIILCETFDHQSATSKSFYSSESILLAVLYQFIPYSSTNATIYVENSTCKSIQICPCTLMTYCPQAKRESLQCEAYIEHLWKFSKLEVGLELHGTFNNLNVENLHPDNDTCVVIQTFRLRSCDLRRMINAEGMTTLHGLIFSVGIIGSVGRQAYSIRIEMDQTFTNRSSWKTCMYKCGLKNSFFTQEIQVVQTSPGKKTVVLEGETLLHENFFVQFNEPIHAKNWIEIQVRFHKAASNRSGRGTNSFVGRISYQVGQCVCWTLILSPSSTTTKRIVAVVVSISLLS